MNGGSGDLKRPRIPRPRTPGPKYIPGYPINQDPIEPAMTLESMMRAGGGWSDIPLRAAEEAHARQMAERQAIDSRIEELSRSVSAPPQGVGPAGGFNVDAELAKLDAIKPIRPKVARPESRLGIVPQAFAGAADVFAALAGQKGEHQDKLRILDEAQRDREYKDALTEAAFKFEEDKSEWGRRLAGLQLRQGAFQRGEDQDFRDRQALLRNALSERGMRVEEEREGRMAEQQRFEREAIERMLKGSGAAGGEGDGELRRQLYAKTVPKGEEGLAQLEQIRQQVANDANMTPEEKLNLLAELDTEKGNRAIEQRLAEGEGWSLGSVWNEILNYPGFGGTPGADTRSEAQRRTQAERNAWQMKLLDWIKRGKPGAPNWQQGEPIPYHLLGR